MKNLSIKTWNCTRGKQDNFLYVTEREMTFSSKTYYSKQVQQVNHVIIKYFAEENTRKKKKRKT